MSHIITSHQGVPGINDKIQIQSGEAGVGGAPHHYVLIPENEKQPWTRLQFPAEGFKEVNVTNEVLLAVLMDRLAGFQCGSQPSNWNRIALDACVIAMTALQERDAAAREKALREAESKSLEDDGR